MQNVMPSSFEIWLQHMKPGGELSYMANVHCLLVEEGVYDIPGGGKIEAQSYLSTVTNHKGEWNGQAQTYNQFYANPVVVGQVMTNNDPNWSVFWSCGSARTAPPSSGALKTGKHVGEDTTTMRVDETVGFIVMERGQGTLLSPEFMMEASVGSDTVSGYGASGTFYQYSYAAPFASTPQVVVVSQAGMDGGDGSWAVLSGTGQSADVLKVTVDEDQIGDTDRAHTNEQLAFIVMENKMLLPSDILVTTPPPPVGPASMQSMVVNAVSDWRNVTLAEGSFTNPIPVCTVQYSGGDDPTVVCMQDVTSCWFEICLQVPGTQTAPATSKNVHCLVVEEGAHTMPDGSKIEAQSYLSTVTDQKGNWNGQTQTYLQSYTQPVVVGQVMTFNDADWSVFWSRGSARDSPAEANDLRTGKHIAEDSYMMCNDETVSFIVIEAGNGSRHFRSKQSSVATPFVGLTMKNLFQFCMTHHLVLCPTSLWSRYLPWMEMMVAGLYC